MSKRIVVTNYVTNDSILAYPEHCIAEGYTFLKDDALATLVDGRKIIKAGTLYEFTRTLADGTTEVDSIGVVRYDVDVTDGDTEGAVIRHGWIRSDLVPADQIPTAAQMALMPMIEYV